jgi:hypothetical protein
VLPDGGPFVRVETGNRATLDYVRDEPPFTVQQGAFLVDGHLIEVVTAPHGETPEDQAEDRIWAVTCSGRDR